MLNCKSPDGPPPGLFTTFVLTPHASGPDRPPARCVAQSLSLPGEGTRRAYSAGRTQNFSGPSSAPAGQPQRPGCRTSRTLHPQHGKTSKPLPVDTPRRMSPGPELTRNNVSLFFFSARAALPLPPACLVPDKTTITSRHPLRRNRELPEKTEKRPP